MTHERKWHALARNTRNNNVLQVYRTDSGFTRERPSSDAGVHMSREEASACVEWGAKRDLAVYATTHQWPFVVLDTDTQWGRPVLSEKLNELGRRQRRYVWVGEYERTSRRQWELRKADLEGWGNTAARCCTRYWGLHSWANCGRDSQSNHRPPGSAADASILHSGRGGAYTNLGDWGHSVRDNMRNLTLCLPVTGESWHVEIGTAWRA